MKEETIESTRFKSNTERETYFNDKFFPYLSALYNYAFYLTKDEDDANDLVQETFVKAFRFMESYQEGTNVKAWLFKIMKNGFINEYRKKSSKPIHFSFDTILESSDGGEEYNPNENGIADDTTETKSLDFKELVGDEVLKALETLSPEFQQIIALADIEDFTYDELSNILTLPVGTIRSRLFRARNALKSKLINYGEQLGFKDNR